MASTLALIGSRAVGFIDWLDVSCDFIERYSPPAKDARNTIAPPTMRMIAIHINDPVSESIANPLP